MTTKNMHKVALLVGMLDFNISIPILLLSLAQTFVQF